MIFPELPRWRSTASVGHPRFGSRWRLAVPSERPIRLFSVEPSSESRICSLNLKTTSSTDAESDSEKASLWDYIPLAEYSRPSPPIAEAVHKRLKTMWARFWNADSNKAEALEDGQKASLEFFNSLFRGPDWSAPIEVLYQSVRERIDQGQKLKVIVGAPTVRRRILCGVSPNAEVGTLSKRRRQKPFLETSIKFPESLGAVPGEMLVIPQLAHWFIRHHNGLNLVRRLLGWVVNAPSPS